MAYKQIDTTSTVTFIPNDIDGSVSVLVFYPGFPLKIGIGREYMPDLIKAGVPDWFDKYVIVIPEEHTTPWDDVLKDYRSEMEARGLKESNLSIGIFSGSGNNNSPITSTLGNLVVENLMLMDPVFSGNIQSSSKKLIEAGSKGYSMYNPKNWKSDPGIAAEQTGKSGIASIIGAANSVDTGETDSDHEKIPTKFLLRFRDQIEPTLISILKPNSVDDGSAETTTESTGGSKTKEIIPDGVYNFNVVKEGIFVLLGTSSTVSKFGELTLIEEEEGEFVFQDDFDQGGFELDDEYLETDFDGLDEEEYNLQEEIVNNIDPREQSENLEGGSTTVEDPVNIKPVSSFDELLRLAGKIAKSLGLNANVKYENLNKGYTNGIHGKCPQGTQAVMYALLGISPKRLWGHADHFSFKKPGTDGGNASFANTGYYNDKIRITQKNGKWSGTYLDNNQSHQWQIGDIIVMGYLNNKPYGHIQIWTGVKWMSDFKQNAIQQKNVDPNTVALWRLNEKGISAIKSQSGNIGKQIS